MHVDRITKVYFSLVKNDITRDIVLFKLRKDFDQQVSEIISRLDIKSLKDKLNTINK